MSALLGYEQVGLIVMTGLFSAPHCTIMCGGIVSAVSLHAKIPAHQSVLLYNVGRVFSYSLLGAVMGAIGSFINVAGKLAGLQGLASIVGGLFVLLWLWRRFQLPFLHRFSALLHKRLASGAPRPAADDCYRDSVWFSPLRPDVCDANDSSRNRLSRRRGGCDGAVWRCYTARAGCCGVCRCTG
jgi:hypothetical protein